MIANAELGSKRTVIRLHRLIMGFPSNTNDIDHIDRNPLNNRRCNLRLCTHAQNTRNMSKHIGITGSKYKGVTWRRGKWRATIGFNYKHKDLGSFNTEEEAALAYNKAASFYFEEYANINLIECKPMSLEHKLKMVSLV